jgi:hypothetical protein
VRQPDLQLVIFAGGEPTLLGEHLLDAIAHCDSLGLATRLVTNASWAKHPTAARRRIIALREAGLTELNISVDDYHLPYIPFENIVNAWRAAHGMGFSAVIIANCYGPKSVVTPTFIQQRLGEKLPLVYDEKGHKQILHVLSEDGTVYGLSNAYLQNLGRSHELIDVSKFFDPRDPSEIAGGCPWAIQSAAISPKNHLVACCGMEAENNPVLDFGSLDEEGVDTLLARANDDVVVAAIAYLGPVYLKRFIELHAPDVPFRNRYHSMCELCEDIVTRRETVSALRQNAGVLAIAVLEERERQELVNSSNILPVL